MSYDDLATDAYYDRKLAEEIEWQANQAERKGYFKIAQILWNAHQAILSEAEEAKANSGQL